MRRNFLLSSIKLILLGVALGLVARYILGDPVSPTDHNRQFNGPVDRTAIESEAGFQLPDIPLTDDLNSDDPLGLNSAEY